MTSTLNDCSFPLFSLIFLNNTHSKTKNPNTPKDLPHK